MKKLVSTGFFTASGLYVLSWILAPSLAKVGAVVLTALAGYLVMRQGEKQA